MPSRSQIVYFFLIPSLLALGITWLMKPSFLSRLVPRYISERTSPPDWDPNYVAPRVFTKEELASTYNGKGDNPAYLVVLGEVYDVTGADYYKEGSGYHVFIGKDATTAFTTGKFGESPSDDVSILDAQQMKAIDDWIKFYRTHEKYKFMGVVQGRYYNKEGKRTRQWRDAKHKLDTAAAELARQEEEAKEMPSCNTRWTQNEGTTMWCEDTMVQTTPTSPLVPRKLETNGAMKCACVEWSTARNNPDKFKEYPGCTGAAQTCFFKQ